MKKSIFLFLLVWLTLLFAACGKKEEAVEYYDIRVESQILEDVEDSQWLLGRQYYQGEPVSLIAERVSAADGAPVMDVYIQPVGKNRQLLLSGVSRTYRSPQWYLDRNGNCFIPQSDGVIRLDTEASHQGNMLYNTKTSGWVKDICGLEDGRIILLTEENKSYSLAELDPVTGVITKIDNVALENSTQYIGASGNRLMLLDAEGFWYVDLKKGTRTLELPFAGTFYAFPENASAVDFWVEGNEAGVIWSNGIEEQLSRINVGEEREIIIVRGAYMSNQGRWLKEQMHLFNQSDDTYYAVLDGWDEGEISDFQTKTNLQLAAGKCADIICGNALLGDIYSMIGNGVFADLTPLMESSGISEKDYFPVAFDSWRHDGKLYGVSLNTSLISYTMDKSLLGNGEELNIETLLGVMLDTDEKRYLFKLDSEWILEFLLQGSEDLWGMVDWDEGSCDFSGELFHRMLRAAKQCAYDKQYDRPEILAWKWNDGFYNFETEKEMESRNSIMAGILFDDGCHAAVNAGSSYLMGINANSKHMEGAWKLITYLLGDEAQSDEEFATSSFPVSRKAFDIVVQREIEAGAVVPIYDAAGRLMGTFSKGGGDAEDLTQEKADEIARYLEDARSLPIRTQPLIMIIQEEAADYFNGIKSEDEVIKMIENRVQLYLDEHGNK